MNCMPDTGASQSIVSAATARDANLQIRPTLTKLCNASNGVMSLLGEADAVLCNERHSAKAVVLVSSDLNHSALIGWQDLQKLCVIPASFPAVAQCFKDVKTKTLAAFPSVFSDTLDNRPMSAKKMKIYLKTIAYRTEFRLPDLFRSGSKSRRMQSCQSIYLLVLLSPAVNPRNGALLHSLYRKATAREFG